MKKIFIITVLCLSIKVIWAQKIPVNEYLTIIKTTNYGLLKGYLEQVTDSTVSLINEKGEVLIPYHAINKIKIKKFRRRLIYSQNAESAQQKLPPNEEILNDNSEKVVQSAIILGHIANGVAYTTDNEDTYVAAQIASVAIPIAGILLRNAFSNIDIFKIKGQRKRYLAEKPILESYSVQYQIQ